LTGHRFVVIQLIHADLSIIGAHCIVLRIRHVGRGAILFAEALLAHQIQIAIVFLAGRAGW